MTTPSTPYTTRRQHDKQQRTGDDGLFALLAAVVDLARRDAATEPDNLHGMTARKRGRSNKRSALAFLSDLCIPIVPVCST